MKALPDALRNSSFLRAFFVLETTSITCEMLDRSWELGDQKNIYDPELLRAFALRKRDNPKIDICELMGNEGDYNDFFYDPDQNYIIFRFHKGSYKRYSAYVILDDSDVFKC